MGQRSLSFLPIVCLILAMFLWGSSFVALKLAFEDYHPMVVIFGRMAVGSVTFLVFFPKLSMTRVKRNDLPLLLFMSLCEPCLYFILEALALQNTSAAQASVITTTLPLLVTVASVIFLGERVSLKILAGLFIAMSGSLILSLGAESSHQAPAPLLGNFYELMAMICAAGYTIAIKKLTRSYSPLYLTATQAWVGTLFFGPILALPQVQLPDEFLIKPIVAIIYLGVVVTLAAYGFYNYALSKMAAAKAAIFVNLIPLFTLILSRFIFNERFTTLQYLAGALIFIGVWVSQTRRRSRHL
ncbi:MAG: DMT family transporter [Thermodesulfobacteriota bacterium]